MRDKRKCGICLAVCLLPFVVMALNAEVFKETTTSGYRFLYLWSTRKFWYAWIVPLFMILIEAYDWAVMYTSFTFISAFTAQKIGDADYIAQLRRYRLDKTDIPYARHFSYWIIGTLHLCIAYGIIKYGTKFIKKLITYKNNAG